MTTDPPIHILAIWRGSRTTWIQRTGVAATFDSTSPWYGLFA
jgi:hypothetical protein